MTKIKFNTYALLFSLLLVTESICSQDGIYLTSEDFLKNKMSYAKAKIKTHEFFRKEFIEVIYRDSLIKLSKKNVFGYKDHKNTSRFFGTSVLEIINPGERILLYKKTSGTGLKNSPFSETYYFSKDAGSDVQALTISNIEDAFPENHEFIKLVGLSFHNDNELTDYDTTHSMYRLNRLLKLTKK